MQASPVGVTAGTFEYSAGIQCDPNIGEIILGRTDTVQQGQMQSITSRNNQLSLTGVEGFKLDLCRKGHTIFSTSKAECEPWIQHC